MSSLNLQGYHLSFDDEFDGTALDTSKWANLYPWGDANLAGETERYASASGSPGTYQVNGGALTITASPNADGTYTSGRISSQNDSFTVGPGTYIEARMQLPGGQDNGMWPAFWTAAKDQAWPPEFDVLEKVDSSSSGLGPSEYSYGTITNDWQSNMIGGWRSAGVDLTTGYHTYGLLWSKDNILTEYFDGQAVASGPVPSDWANHPQYLEANLAVGSNQSPADCAGPPNGSTGTLKIDYIRKRSGTPTLRSSLRL